MRGGDLNTTRPVAAGLRPPAESARAPAQPAGRDHNVGMPELDPAGVIEAVARDPRLRAFTSHGRIENLPARQARRRLLLDKIAQAFEPGVRYSEGHVSSFLGALHPRGTRDLLRCVRIRPHRTDPGQGISPSGDLTAGRAGTES